MKFQHVFVIGAGGVGSNLAEPLTRLLAFHKNGTRNLTIIDGDEYEEKNQERQLFDAQFIGFNKAQALAERLSQSVFPVEHIADYTNHEKFLNTLDARVAKEDLILVIAAVDNHATRKAIIEALDESERPNFAFISGGNGLNHGQVMVYAKVEGESPMVHPFDKYEDLKYPDDHIPGTPGCQDEAPSEPQLITANMGAALGIMWEVYAMLEDKMWFEEIHFDSRRMKIEPQGDGIKLMGLTK